MTAKRPWKITHTEWQQNSIVDDDDNLVCECVTGHEPSREFADECAADIVRAVNAAPKMYEALKDTMEVMRRFRDMCPKEYDDMTRYIGIEWATMWDNNKAALKAAGGDNGNLHL